MTDLTTLDSEELEAQLLEQHRAELTGYCYRMLGSSSDKGAVQDTMVQHVAGLRRNSKAARRCAPGSTASRPTCASTC